MDLDAVRAFVKTAETQSFTKAAEQLGVSKSRVSLRVRTLEDALGVALLQRTTRAVQLTSAGDELLPRARQLLVDADDLAAVFQAPTELDGELRVDVPVALARNVIIPRLPELFAHHPRLRLHLSTTDRRVDLVREGFDCVLRVGQLADSALVARKIGSMTMTNAASPSYLKKHGVPTALAHLSAHKIVHYGGGPPTFEHGTKQVPMAATLTVNSTDAYKAAALAGFGIIQAPHFGLREHFTSGELVEVLPRFVCRPLPVSLLHAHQAHVPKRLRVFMQWLGDVVRPVL